MTVELCIRAAGFILFFAALSGFLVKRLKFRHHIPAMAVSVLMIVIDFGTSWASVALDLIAVASASGLILMWWFDRKTGA